MFVVCMGIDKPDMKAIVKYMSIMNLIFGRIQNE